MASDPTASGSESRSSEASVSASLHAGLPILPKGAEIRVALLHKRQALPDEHLLQQIEIELQRKGCRVYSDQRRLHGMEWAKELEFQIRNAHLVIPLLSPASLRSEIFTFEVEIAHESAQRQERGPILLPVRVNYDGLLPESLTGILATLPHLSWKGPPDNPRFIAELLSVLSQVAGQMDSPRKPAPLRVAFDSLARLRAVTPPRLNEPPPDAGAAGGALPLGSKYYIAREEDAEFKTAIQRKDSIILVKGARQMGKTSLLARVLEQARRHGAKVVQVDLQKLNASLFESADKLYLTLAELIVEELGFEVVPSAIWDARRGANINFDRFLRREILEKLAAPLVWGIDEVDRLFHLPFSNEMFALFRSWHNERALDPRGPWADLTLAIAYATEAHLFIRDLNQSPFNVGTRLALQDFTRDQVADLNERYEAPLKNAGEIARFHRLVNGHPYLISRGLHEMTAHKMRIDELEIQADHDDGLYGDHLRRMLVLLAKDPELCEAVREVLAGQACPSSESFYRLRSAGVFTGGSEKDAKPRCQIYANYLAKHLL